MELNFDHGALRTVPVPGDSPAELRALDWVGLKARFTAAHALRRTMDDAAGQAPGGNFSDDAAAFFAASREASTAVNPNDLANGKALDAMDANIVGTTPQIDDRGQV